MAGLDEVEWAAHLGAGLILCCFGKYEEALSSLFRCHQLALHCDSDNHQGDRCRVDVAARALCEAVGKIQQARGSEVSYEVMTSHFLRYNSCSQSAQAWSAFFVGWALFVAERESDSSSTSTRDEQLLWLNRSLDLAPHDLCYIECSAREIISKITPRATLQMKLDRLKMWMEAAARWGNLDQEVYALYAYGTVCIKEEQHGEVVWSREMMKELITKPSVGTDVLRIALYFCFYGWTANDRFDKERVMYGMLVMTFLEESIALAAPTKSWSSYFGYCATPGSIQASNSSPTRDERLFRCLGNALGAIIRTHWRDERRSLIAMGALAKFKRLKGLGEIFRSKHGMKQGHLDYLLEIHIQLTKFKGETCSARVESVLAKTLQLSQTCGKWRKCASTLINMVRLAENLKADSRFYYQRGDDAGNEDRAHFEMIDSFIQERVRLARQHDESCLFRILCFRAIYLFRMQEMDKVIEILEPVGKTLLERSYKLGAFSTDRISYTDWESHYFEMLQAALISCHQPDRALMWAERDRAQDLLHNLKKHESAASFKEKIMEFNLDEEEALLHISSISRDAGEDTAFLVYTTVLEGNGLCGFLLHQTVKRACFTKFEPALHISAEVQQITQKLQQSRSELNVEQLQKWYKHLILPFQAELDNIKPRKLVIVPGKHLAGLPFAALYEGPGEPFLIEKYAISYIPSLRMYLHCKRRGEALMISCKRMSAVVIGNPTTGIAADLPYAGKEAESTKHVLQKAGFQDVYLLHEDQATKSAILESLPTSDWVHYAGHAVVSRDFPHGALLLASEGSPVPTVPADGDDQGSCTIRVSDPGSSSAHSEPEDSSVGMRVLRYAQSRPRSEVLTGDEIETCGLKLQPLVTVLSACQSGLGEVFSEGVLGLHRALHVAGAPSVLCSLWNLDDEYSMSFMEQLYERLYSHREELAIALREVMVDMINESDPIEKWAAFIISGSPHMKLIQP